MAEDAHTPRSPQPQTFLVVDDDPSIVALCSTKLEQAGFTVLRAGGSSEALKICKEHRGPIHLVLIDLLLPLPGLQLAAEKNPFPRVHGHQLPGLLLAQRKGIRVAFMSGYSDPELKGLGIARKTIPFLRKPFTGEQLVQTVREVLAGPPFVIESKAQAATKKKALEDDEWLG